MRPSRAEVLELLDDVGVPPNVISHSLKVEEIANEIAVKISRNGVRIDLQLVSLGALIHDIGRSSTHGIDHGIAGAGILRESMFCARVFNDQDREALARICERHIGGGIPANDAVKAGLPARDFVPLTIEEKVVAHADNLVRNGVVSLEETLRVLKRRFGKGSTVMKRVKDLGNEIECLAGSVFEGNHDTGEDVQKSSRCQEESDQDSG